MQLKFATIHATTAVSHVLIGFSVIDAAHAMYWLYFVVGFLDIVMAFLYVRSHLTKAGHHEVHGNDKE